MPDSTSTGNTRQPQKRRRFTPPNLARTRGPAPDTPLDDVQLAVGRVVGTHGLDGELRVQLLTDNPEHLLEAEQLLVGDQRTPYTIDSIRFHKGLALIAFDEIVDVDAAETLRGSVLRISGSDLPPLAENEYYLYQVVGIEARTEAGEVIGTVSDVIETGANNVFVVTPADGGKELLFPSIPDVVTDIRPTDGYLVIRPQTWWDDQP
ncbi:MAG TPA: ribosome maturation factor RimM [Thermomicrobiales bacterium]|nr:ribosome maturation factor RimM [Thermomicrobiales bacterium]